MQYQGMNPRILQQASQLVFRQSLLQDYFTCPQQALYRYIYGLESEYSYFAAFLGTAGHAVIDTMHKNRKFDYTWTALQKMFVNAFNEAIEQSDQLPKLNKGFTSVSQQLWSVLADYLEMIRNYQQDENNQKFNAVFFEQAFAMELENPFDSSGNGKPFLFTGQIDQGGFYDNGLFALRDLKFRDNAFKPSKIELKLSTQGVIYSLAAKYGNPVCDACRPRYDINPLTQEKVLEYDGPCDSCKEIANDKYKWPSRTPDKWELMWMRDYQPLKRGTKGKKKGDLRGPGCHSITIDEANAHARLEDVLRACQSIRSGAFYRRPSSYCNSFCHWREPCLNAIEMKTQENIEEEMKDLVTIDPFA